MPNHLSNEELENLSQKVKEVMFKNFPQIQEVFWDGKTKKLKVLQGPNQEIFIGMRSEEKEERARAIEDLPREEQNLRASMSYMTGVLEVMYELSWASWKRQDE